MSIQFEITPGPLSDTAIESLAALLLSLDEPGDSQSSPQETANGSTRSRETRCRRDI